jgi:hypothetical protein
MIGVMEPDGRTYLLPHPAIARIILSVAGAFALVITPYELWRGVWPLNITSPFFGFIMVGGMTVGAAFLIGGLLAPTSRLVFAPGSVRVFSVNVWGRWERVYLAADLEALAVDEQGSSDGPPDFYAVMRFRGGGAVASRPLGSRAAAERQLAEFEAALGLGAG